MYLRVFEIRDISYKTTPSPFPCSSITHAHIIHTSTLPTQTLLTIKYTQVLWFLPRLTRSRSSFCVTIRIVCSTLGIQCIRDIYHKFFYLPMWHMVCVHFERFIGFTWDRYVDTHVDSDGFQVGFTRGSGRICLPRDFVQGKWRSLKEHVSLGDTVSGVTFFPLTLVFFYSDVTKFSKKKKLFLRI